MMHRKQTKWVGLFLCCYLFITSCVAVQEELESVNTPTPLSRSDKSEHWSPLPGMTFQIQFSGEINLNVDAQVFDLDAFETTKEDVETLHKAGKFAVCYLNAGAVEDWRPDHELFQTEIIGKAYAGWPGENWLDIRQIDKLEEILDARLQMCKQKGFDGVEFDNVDGYQNNTGFDLTAEDQIQFNRWLAEQAHANGLAVGLKNDPDQVGDLEPYFDFVILESCFEQGWCELAQPFSQVGKPVFAIEYAGIEPYCAQAQSLNITLIGKNLQLDSALKTCP